MNTPVLQTNIPAWPVRRGKVRDVYDLGDRLLLVATDRISAFDWVLPTGIPDKGRVLTQTSIFWFEQLGEPNHLLSVEPREFGLPPGVDPEPLTGRAMLVRKTEVVPIECVVRGYLSGSGWKEYRQTGSVCGVKLPAGLVESDRLPEPIFTPATKEETGHDVNISFGQMRELIDPAVADELRRRSLAIYSRGAELGRSRGIIIADTKFEFGILPPAEKGTVPFSSADSGKGESPRRQFDGKVILIDEVLTPDSSRFWPADVYKPGQGQPSFDKQFVRDWLESTGWDKNSPPPPLPDEVVQRTREKYIEAYETLTGRQFGWKK